MNNDDKIALVIATMLLTVVLFAMSIHLVDAKQVCEKTILYSLTSHPQAEHTILCHPIGKELVKANNANIKFNKGVVAAHKSTILNCASNDKNFCQGWDFVRKYG